MIKARVLIDVAQGDDTYEQVRAELLRWVTADHVADLVLEATGKHHAGGNPEYLVEGTIAQVAAVLWSYTATVADFLAAFDRVTTFSDQKPNLLASSGEDGFDTGFALVDLIGTVLGGDAGVGNVSTTRPSDQLDVALVNGERFKIDVRRYHPQPGDDYDVDVVPNRRRTATA